MAYQYRNNGRNGNGCGCQGENGSGRTGRDGNYPAGGRFGEGRMNDGRRGDGRMNNGIMNEGHMDGGRMDSGKNTDCGCGGNGSRSGGTMGGPHGIVGFAGTDGPAAPVPQDAAFAMAYVPVQPWGEIYDLDKALQRGTIFADLDKPFLGEKARCRK
ncbi:MAG: spore coat associated protein CotJA [Lachnospiraceae bacterium]|nr:spore coat associated protein CotJA [Lachnospiraceae bacterium]